MNAKGQIIGTATAKLPGLDDTFSFHWLCQLTRKEYFLFHVSSLLLSQYITNGHPPARSLGISVYFTAGDEITLELGEDTVLGIASIDIFLRVDKWRKHKCGDLLVLFTYLEELAHQLWDIRDEIAVKRVVTEILQPLLPEITFEMLFDESYPPNPKPVFRNWIIRMSQDYVPDVPDPALLSDYPPSAQPSPASDPAKET